MDSDFTPTKFQSFGVDGPHDRKINILLNIHVDVVVGAQNVVHHFEFQTAFDKP